MSVDLGKKVQIEQLECTRCDRKWWPRLDESGVSVLPKTCPKCKSPYWNKVLQRKSVSEARKKK
jgi:hypothetical protein